MDPQDLTIRVIPCTNVIFYNIQSTRAMHLTRAPCVNRPMNTVPSGLGCDVGQSFVSAFLPTWLFMDVNVGLRPFITPPTASGMS